MKKLLLALGLLLATAVPAYAQLELFQGIIDSNNCFATSNPTTNAVWCFQKQNLTNPTQTAGQMYLYKGPSLGWVAQLGVGGGGGGTGTITGTGVANQLTYWSGTTAIAGSAGMTVNPATSAITATSFIGSLTGTASLATALVGTPTLCSAGQAPRGILANGNATGCTAISGGFGPPVTLDLGNDGSNESAGIGSIAIWHDTNAIFTEPTADKLLIDVAKKWPAAGVADALANNGANCAAGSAPLGVDAAGAVEGCFAVQAVDAELTAIAGLTSAADKLPYFTGPGTAALADLTPFGRSLIDDANAAAARTTLGVVIGTDVQAQDAELQAIAGLTSAADRLPYFTGAGTAALATFTAFARTLLDDIDAAAMRATIGAQGLDAELTALASVTSANDKVPYFTGSGTAAVADFTAYGRLIVATANEAAFKALVNLEDADILAAVNAAGGVGVSCTDVGSSDAYVCAPAVAPVAYVSNGSYRMKVATANTGAASATFTPLTLKTIKKWVSGAKTDLVTGDICAGQIVDMTYDGTDMVMQSVSCNPSTGGSGSITATTGTILKAGSTTTGVDSSIIEDADSINFSKPIEACVGPCLFAMDTSVFATTLKTWGFPVNANDTFMGLVAFQTPTNKTIDDATNTLKVTKSIQAELYAPTTDTATCTGCFYFRVPASLNGTDLVGIQSNTVTGGTTGLTSVQITKCTAVSTTPLCSGVTVSMLSTVVSIDSGETSSSNAATAAVISGTAGVKSVSAGQILRFDVTAINTTPAKGLLVNLDFKLP